MINTETGVEPGSVPVARPRLTVVSGPSGVGKSSVLDALRARLPDVYFSVSVTTRAPRSGEVDGQHYHFVDTAEFERMIAEGAMLEYARYAGNYYGTPRGPVETELAAGRPAVLEIELQGARQIRRAKPDAQLVMLLPPSWEVLVDRLTDRGTEKSEVVRDRLDTARQEIAAAEEFDATLVNADVQATASELIQLVVGRGPGEPSAGESAQR